MKNFKLLLSGLCLGFAALLFASASNNAFAIAVLNHSFEDDPTNSGPFFFGNPTGWSLIDDGGIISGNNFTNVQGTLSLPGQPFYNGVAPDGNNIALLFVSGSNQVGTTEIGLGQVLSTNLAANTQYTLSVEVGNIGSGTGTFDLSGFPGYRIELLAGGNVLVDDLELTDSPIGEDVFQTRNLTFSTGANPLFLDQALEIRLFNLNISDNSNGAALEVNFDNIRLDAVSTVPGPASLPLMSSGIGLLGYLRWRRKRKGDTYSATDES
jgi:hapalindole H/12-epi-hapalindole U/12-epi-fischerindole U synthase